SGANLRPGGWSRFSATTSRVAFVVWSWVVWACAPLQAARLMSRLAAATMRSIDRCRYDTLISFACKKGDTCSETSRWPIASGRSHEENASVGPLHLLTLFRG